MKEKGAGFISQMVDETLTSYRLNLLNTVNAPNFTCTITDHKSFILKSGSKELEIPMNFSSILGLSRGESYQIDRNSDENEFFELLVQYFNFENSLSKLIFVKNFDIDDEFLVYQEFNHEQKSAA